MLATLTVTDVSDLPRNKLDSDEGETFAASFRFSNEVAFFLYALMAAGSADEAGASFGGALCRSASGVLVLPASAVGVVGRALNAGMGGGALGVGHLGSLRRLVSEPCCVAFWFAVAAQIKSGRTRFISSPLA